MKWPNPFRKKPQEAVGVVGPTMRASPLREFVYLDEVSVYSLIASREGSIPTGMTQSEAVTLQAEANAAAGVNIPIAKSELGMRFQRETAHGTQIVRKSIIQSAFKQLYESEQAQLRLRLADAEAATKAFPSLEALSQAAVSGVAETYLMDPASLGRGALVELEVTLETEPLFQANAVISTLLEIVRDNPGAVGLGDTVGQGNVIAANQILDKLFSGLIPVRGRAQSYSVVELGGSEFIVHNAAIPESAEGLVVRPLELTGVAEQGWFWKDVRRVLFDGASYQVLARLTRGGIQREWSPIKLLDVFRTVASADVQASIAGVSRDVARKMGQPAPVIGDPPAPDVPEVIKRYGSALAERLGIALDPEEFGDAVLGRDLPDALPRSPEFWREAFAPATQYVQALSGTEIDRSLAADLRMAVLRETHYLADVDAVAVSTAGSPAGEIEVRYLDSELIAIYW